MSEYETQSERIDPPNGVFVGSHCAYKPEAERRKYSKINFFIMQIFIC